jgi:hypothetical protein
MGNKVMGGGFDNPRLHLTHDWSPPSRRLDIVTTVGSITIMANNFQ